MAYKKDFSGLDSIDDRRWSDDQGYLDTINWLTNKSHEASMNDQDVYDWFFILEQLQLEITGQLIVRGLTKELSDLKDIQSVTSKRLDNIYKKYNNDVSGFSTRDTSRLRSIVFPYHEKITILIHQMDLRLHDVQPTKKKLAVEDDY